MGEVRKYEAEKHTFSLLCGRAYHKLFKIQFNRNDGSLFVHVPYYRDCEGIVAVCTLPAGNYRDVVVNLTDDGRVTSHRVKYSHHPDGRAHFSQDARVLTTIRRNSEPLHGFTGHVFTLQVQGPSEFAALRDPDRPRRTSTEHDHLVSLRGDGASTTFKFVGEWTSTARFADQLVHGDVGPNVLVGDDSERPDIALLVGPAPGRPPEAHFLMITCQQTDVLMTNEESCLVLIGGFDSPERVDNREEPTSFLAMQYPASDVEALRQAIGTIDLQDRPQIAG